MSCRLFHEWGQWSKVTVTRYYTSGREIDVTQQQRTCARCGKTQWADL